jgi:hypothetical protein
MLKTCVQLWRDISLKSCRFLIPDFKIHSPHLIKTCAVFCENVMIFYCFLLLFYLHIFGLDRFNYWMKIFIRFLAKCLALCNQLYVFGKNKFGLVIRIFYVCNPINFIWGISSFGRALAWHARGDRFDSGILHKFPKLLPR